jgi:nicotinamide-nucleotide amidase
MRAIILSVGDELVLGQTVDTNSAWLSQQLAAVGCAVAGHLTVGDDQRAIEQAIEESVGRCDVLLISGGIGPTKDDLTRQALAAVLREPLELNEAWLRQLEEFFRTLGRRVMSPLNRVQAMIPRGATIIENTNGTAAGIDATYLSGDQKTVCRVFVMPGVPKEMKAMFLRDVLPHVRGAAGGAVILSRTLHTFGLGESPLAEKLGPLMDRKRNPTVGTTVSGGIVSVRINARFPALDEAQRELQKTEAACRAALGDLVFGQDEDTLPGVVAKTLLKASVASVTSVAFANAVTSAASVASAGSVAPATVATAESCTGGLLAKMLTDTPGSSRYFKYGWVTYANDAKTELLGVGPEVLREHGAVSEQTVRAMAAAARQRGKADYAVAISGIAGPEGGTPDKPVGTVWIALAHPQGVHARRFVFPGDREMIRDRSAKMALALLRFRLMGKEPEF